MGRQAFTMAWRNAGQTAEIHIDYDASYDPATNSSKVKMSGVEFHDGLVGYTAGRIYFNGTEVMAINGMSTAWYPVSAPEVTVPHNDDGSGSFTISFAPYGAGYSQFHVQPRNTSANFVISETSRTVSLDGMQRKFTLHITSGKGSTTTVKNGGTALWDGATITYGDTLSVTCAASTGYRLTKNPTGSIVVSGDVSVSSEAAVNSYTLSTAFGEHLSAAVERTSSPLQGAAKGKLSGGNTVYYGDVLKFTYSVDTGYKVTNATVNGIPFTSGKTTDVKSNIAVVVSTDVLAVVHISNGGEFGLYLVEIVSGGSASLYQPHIVNGGVWKPYM